MSHLICLASDAPLPALSDPRSPSEICVTIDRETGSVDLSPEDCWDIWPMPGTDHLHTALPYLAEAVWYRCTPGLAAELADYIRRHLERAETVELWNFWDGSDVELVRVHREEVPLAELTPEKIIALCEKDAAYPTLLGGIEEFQQYCLCITR